MDGSRCPAQALRSAKPAKLICAEQNLLWALPQPPLRPKQPFFSSTPANTLIVPLNHGLERNHVFRKVVQLLGTFTPASRCDSTKGDSGLTANQQGNPRTTSLLAVAKENGLEIEFVDTEPAKGVSADYLKLNKLGKVPTFEGADGFVLSECIAIAVYCKYAELLLCQPVK
jgi:hypothetical protein